MIFFLLGLILGIAIGYKLKKGKCYHCKKSVKPEGMEYGN